MLRNYKFDFTIKFIAFSAEPFMNRTTPADGTCYYVVRGIDANGGEGNASAPAMLTIEVG